PSACDRNFVAETVGVAYPAVEPSANRLLPATAPLMDVPHHAPDSLLKHRPFVLYWSARVSSVFAFQVMGVAMGWQMYAITGDPLDLGFVGLVQFLPATVLILVTGQLADRYDRRRIAQIAQFVEGCAAATLAYGALTGTTSKGMILAAAFCLGAGRAGDAPTM